jgi:outer membrane protein assembly factor BamB
MRHRVTRAPVILALASILASFLLVIVPGTASAEGSLPDMQWNPVLSRADGYNQMTTSPKGDVTIGCHHSAAQDLVTYNITGARSRHLKRTPQVDGKDNCIENPIVDKNGNLYGGLTNGYLYAYNGNTLRWKYQTNCTLYATRPVVGADGNIYTINNNGRLIGLTPELEPGKTQPKTILDVTVSGSRCDDKLRATKDGFALIWDYGTKLKYLSYSGKILSTLSGGNYDNDLNFPMNADGDLFFPTDIAGGGMQVSKWDVSRQQVAWTVRATTPTAGRYFFSREIWPTPDGGVITYLLEQKMVSEGVPATPIEYVPTITRFNISGVKLWSKALPSKDTSGNIFSYNAYIAVDTTGKLVVNREYFFDLLQLFFCELCGVCIAPMATEDTGQAPSVPILQPTIYCANALANVQGNALARQTLVRRHDGLSFQANEQDGRIAVEGYENCTFFVCDFCF